MQIGEWTWWRPALLGNVTNSLVLCYHAVSPTWTAALSVTPDDLERQLSWFVARGWSGSTFSDAVLRPGNRALAVTFDDAFLSVFQLARPILQALGLPGTVFAPTSFMSVRQPLAWPGVDHWLATSDALELESMSWNELRDLSEDGWEIGSHTRTHPRLTGLTEEALWEELRESRADVTRFLGRPCTSIAYPYGDVNGRVAAVAGGAGYITGAALSSRLAPLGPLRWPRIGIYHADRWTRFRLKASRVTRVPRASRLWPGESSPL